MNKSKKKYIRFTIEGLFVQFDLHKVLLQKRTGKVHSNQTRRINRRLNSFWECSTTNSHPFIHIKCDQIKTNRILCANTLTRPFALAKYISPRTKNKKVKSRAFTSASLIFRFGCWNIDVIHYISKSIVDHIIDVHCNCLRLLIMTTMTVSMLATFSCLFFSHASLCVCVHVYGRERERVYV